MKAITAMLLLLCACTCIAGDPSVTWQINVANGQKEYVYTLVNGSAHDITSFRLNMPEAGAASVISFTGGPTDWYAGHSFYGRGDLSFWGMFGDESSSIHPGDLAAFTLTTADTVPTTYDFSPPGKPGNWTWVYWTGIGDGIVNGIGSLPVQPLSHPPSSPSRPG